MTNTMIRHAWFPPFGMFLCVLVATYLVAQEPPAVDPFGESKEAPKAAPAGAKKKAAPEKVETDPIVIGILESKPTTPPDVMQAIINLANYGRVDVAKRYIVALINSNLDDATNWKLQRHFGSAVFFRLSSQEDLQPEGRQLADIVLGGAQKYVRDPARLDALIKQLSDTNLELRQAALVDLQEAREEAVAALISVLGDSARASERPTIHAALRRMGRTAIGPLLGALDVPNEEWRSEIVTVLGNMQTLDALPFLLRPYLQSAAGSPQQLAAKSALSKTLEALPSKSDAERFLHGEVVSYLEGKLPGKLDHENRIEMWKWDDTQKRPVRGLFDPIAAPLLLAARLGSELTAIAPENRQYRLLHLVASLESAKAESGWDQPLPSGTGTAFDFAKKNLDMSEEVLRYSLDRGHVGSAIAALEVMGGAGDASFLRSSGGQPREVAKALRHPNRRVRFAALQAVLQIAPQSPYAGASYLPEALGYFARTAGTRRVLIGHPRPEISQSMAGIFLELGIDSDVTSTGREALQLARRNSDYELVLLSDALDNPNIQEQVQQFRREPLTAKLPIGVLARTEVSSGMQVPPQGSGTGGIADGNSFVLSDSIQTATFEFDNDGVSKGVRVPLGGITQTSIADEIVSAIRSQDIIFSPVHVGGGRIVLGAIGNHKVDLAGTPTLTTLPVNTENFDRLHRLLEGDTLTEVFAQPTDAVGVSFVMRRLLGHAGRDFVSQEERLRQAAVALDQWAVLASNAEAFGFYELLPQQQAAESALSVPSLNHKAAKVLGLLATPQSQRLLVEVVNQNGRSIADRQAAAAAFDVAVKRRGVLLTKTEILRQYDLYNRSANADAATQQVLGAVLDTIEAPRVTTVATTEPPSP
jgi:CheY-like chemotaxis protein